MSDASRPEDAVDDDALDDDALDDAGACGTSSDAVPDPTQLAALDGLPVAEHLPVYAALHARLQDALASLDGV